MTLPLEFRLQIVVEVAPATGNDSSRSAPPRRIAHGARLPQLVESAQSLLEELTRGLAVQTASFTWPGGVRLVVQGSARPEDLREIRAVAEALGRTPLTADDGATPAAAESSAPLVAVENGVSS